MANLAIGIDSSKQTFDASLVFNLNDTKNAPHCSFRNSKEGYEDLIKWVSANTTVKRSEWLFCGEQTGSYSYGLAKYLSQKHLNVWLDDPCQILHSSGVRLDKTDALDSLAIAEYAIRFQDRAKLFVPDSKTMREIEALQSYRQIMVNETVTYQNHLTELKYKHEHDSVFSGIAKDIERQIKNLKVKIKKVEKQIEGLMKTDDSMHENYELITSIKGVGSCTATAIILATRNFQKCNNPRQFARYAGVAPVKHESGTSIKRGDHTCKRCNKAIKVLLTQCAQSAAQYDPEMKEYMNRMKARGKEHNLIINNIRYKLIRRIFSVVRNRRTFIVGKKNFEMMKAMDERANCSLI